MNGLLWGMVIVAVWLILQIVVLPWFGVAT
jgi:hypothetical protein